MLVIQIIYKNRFLVENKYVFLLNEIVGTIKFNQRVLLINKCILIEVSNFKKYKIINITY